MHHCAESIFKVDYLREYESVFETALAHESVDPGVLFDEKIRGRKSRETVPLSLNNWKGLGEDSNRDLGFLSGHSPLFEFGIPQKILFL
jgi:hypothetical protein